MKAIDEEIKQDPNNCDLKKERREIDDQILKCEIDLKDEVEMKLTKDEKMAHSNAWRSHCETTEGLKKSSMGKKGSSRNTKYISDAEWKAMSPEAQTKKAAGEDEVDKSSTSSKSAKTMKSMSKTIKSQEKDNRSQNER